MQKLTFGALLAEKAQNQGATVKIFMPETLDDKIREYQLAHKAINNSHISKEKVLYILAEDALDRLIFELANQKQPI